MVACLFVAQPQQASVRLPSGPAGVPALLASDLDKAPQADLARRGRT